MSRDKIIVEFNTLRSAHIAYAYLSNMLGKKSGASVFAYRPSPVRVFWLPGGFGNIAYWVFWRFFNNHGAVYRSFGARNLILPRVRFGERAKAARIVKLFLDTNPTKHDLETLTVLDVEIGELVYDTYLRRFSEPTVKFNDDRLRQVLESCVESLIFWKRRLAKGDIKAIIVSHTVYDLAIPLRVALKLGIPGFMANVDDLYRLSEERPLSGMEFLDFPKIFSTLTDAQKEDGLNEAERRLARRFGGEVGVDMHYSKVSAYGAERLPRVLSHSPKKKMLIAAHCFFDSPHCFGKNLFPDFWEWLTFLGELSERTDFEWYVKSHPDGLPGNKEILDAFYSRYSKFTPLPADVSHHQLIEEGIDVGLTVYGTIGFEYAALGVPIINASRNNPHVAYPFNYHPSSISEYETLIQTVDKSNRKFHRNQVVEYYFMRHIYTRHSLFFEDWARTLERLGGYEGQFSPKVFNEFLTQFTGARDREIRRKIEGFLEGNGYSNHTGMGLLQVMTSRVVV